MKFDISLHEVCVWVGVRYVITKFSRMDSLPNFLTHGATQARESSAIIIPFLAFLSISIINSSFNQLNISRLLSVSVSLDLTRLLLFSIAFFFLILPSRL